MKPRYRLGTRRSLLAWAQSSWVAREVERLNPGVRVDLVGIDTRGDKIQDVPLQAVEGKEFFVAEIDEALRTQAVDFTVHSMKDLSLERPPEFVTGAIPRRENPRDVVLFGPGVLDKIERGQTLRIGTSSPRRIENIPAFLRQALPKLGPGARVELIEIRGNVNTRLSRVHEAAGSPKALDAVVLAFAGLIRLWRDDKGREELSKLLQGVRWMVLPLKECPAAPAQGALAIECRRNDPGVRAALEKLDHLPTATQVARERQLLADWGGGCHQRFGATAVSSGRAGDLLYIRGKKPDGEAVDELRWNAPPRPRGEVRAWDGNEWREKESEKPYSVEAPPSIQAVFVAHHRAATPAFVSDLRRARIWTSGTASWFMLAEKGLWVEGSAEGLGMDYIAATLQEPVLALPSAWSSWTLLTHADAPREPAGIRKVASYELLPSRYGATARAALAGATHVYLGSASQFDEIRAELPACAVLACGPGKTAAHLAEAGLKPLVFPSVEEWKKWIKN